MPIISIKRVLHMIEFTWHLSSHMPQRYGSAVTLGLLEPHGRAVPVSDKSIRSSHPILSESGLMRMSHNIS